VNAVVKVVAPPSAMHRRVVRGGAPSARAIFAPCTTLALLLAASGSFYC